MPGYQSIGPFESAMWEDMANVTGIDELRYDDYAETLFHQGYFDGGISSDGRMFAREELNDYLAREYLIDFDEAFDWEVWRELYE